MAAGRLPVVAAVFGAVFLGMPSAGATPPGDPSPVEPAPVPPEGIIAGIGTALGQTGSVPAGPLGLPDLSALGPALLLAQNPAPTAPGISVPPIAPSLSAFDPAYLVPLNIDPAAPGEGVPAPGLGPHPDSPGTGRLAFLQRLREMYSAGQLRGALLGQQPFESAPEALTESPGPTAP